MYIKSFIMPEKYKLYNIAQIKLQMSIRYIYILILILLFNNQVIAQEYKKMSESINPYGDGLASKRITEIIKKEQ